ncbi:SDR family oxidoreductase [Sphingopyxis sp. OPL5]|uniref:SDR family oxidoreductase n=1 Tax=Sphingopyxis sp. OPL5 TaxID=2486273 RepID=UPI00164D71F3|nr:SDR family oxidoreductase [Sphingopyxis sp. OPL5]QNO27927.1 SDR family oxidoreductase [Sphingopyxis sp. OPL5]
MTLLTGKSVIITGIGPGLGRVIAEEAARLGADVAMVSRSGAIMAEVAASAPAGARMIAIQADITSDADCAAVAEQTVAAFGMIDGLVNSAYRPGDIKPVMDIDLDELARAFDVTVLGTLRMIRAVVPQMERQGGGAIVNIGSQVARKHVMNQGGYAATKAAQSALTRYLAIELGPKNIRFNTPSFGWTISPPARAWLEQQEADGGPSVSESIAGIAGGLALNRVPADEEYARAALALVSDYFSSVTGATLDVNGGEYMPL